jgi:hypothetical protein
MGTSGQGAPYDNRNLRRSERPRAVDARGAGDAGPHAVHETPGLTTPNVIVLNT